MGDQLIVQLGGVAFVLGKLVLGVLPVQLQHIAVTADLCQNGGGSNAGAGSVSLDDGFGGDAKPRRAAVAVDQRIVGRGVQPCHRLRHSVHCRPQDVALVDLLRGDKHNFIRQSAGGDLVKQGFAALFGQFFGIIDPRNGVVGV